jgi:hypothetical protein
MRITQPRLAAVALGVLAPVALAAAGGGNHVHVVVERVDDDFTPESAFFTLFDIALPDETGVTSVTVTLPDGTPILLEDEGDGEWAEERDFADFASLKSAVNGTWTIDVAGSSPSTTTFLLDLESLVDGDLFATPTMVNPQSGETGVANDVVFAWADPTGESTADILFIEVESGYGEDEVYQEDDSHTGTLTVDDTTWDPPLDLPDGMNELAIMYLDADDGTRVGPLTLVSGSIAWGDSPFAPPGYPASSPMLAIGSERIIVFEVGTPCPADLDGSGGVAFGDLLQMLVAWGPCLDCPADLDGSGDVGFGDLLQLLVAWGPCPE